MEKGADVCRLRFKEGGDINVFGRERREKRAQGGWMCDSTCHFSATPDRSYMFFYAVDIIVICSTLILEK
jgi:hypothetical protein